MIELIPDFPGPIVAASFSGQISATDIDSVLIAAVLERREKYDTLRLLLYYTADFRRFTTTNAWDDRTVGLHHLDDFERVAIIADVAWLARLAEGLENSRPDDVRRFAVEDFTVAKHWVCDG